MLLYPEILPSFDEIPLKIYLNYIKWSYYLLDKPYFHCQTYHHKYVFSSKKDLFIFVLQVFVVNA